MVMGPNTDRLVPIARSSMLGAFTTDMGGGDARVGGMHRFVERRVLGFGAKLGLALVVWNVVVGGTLLNYDVHRLALEGAYYLLGSMALSGIGAMVEWSYLERKFGRATPS